jgi:excisionase family DNA binding protein
MTTLTRQEAAKYIGVGISTFKKLQKEIRAIRIGRKVLFDTKDLDAYLESKKVGGLNE